MCVYSCVYGTEEGAPIAYQGRLRVVDAESLYVSVCMCVCERAYALIYAYVCDMHTYMPAFIHTERTWRGHVSRSWLKATISVVCRDFVQQHVAQAISNAQNAAVWTYTRMYAYLYI